MSIEKWKKLEESFAVLSFEDLIVKISNENSSFHRENPVNLKSQIIEASIKKFLSRQKQELLGNGVSQWKNYGIEKGYWAYFKQEIKDELLGELDLMMIERVSGMAGISEIKKIINERI